ncbi:DNA polymerase beta superfamily protein [Empedobacter falsenii]
MKLTIEDLKSQNLILFECISGSKAYNLNTKNSDTDIRGVFYLPKNEFYGFEYQAQISNETNDILYYEIGRFIELLLKNNPSCLEILATPEEYILYKSPLLDELNYNDFITSEVEKTFIGYALSQIKKAKGLNKKFLNPIDKIRKTVLDFCYIIDDNATPEEYILYKSPLLDELNYNDFITSEVEKTFIGYALSQIKKAKGLNKKFLNPIDKIRKTVLDFCYIIDDNKTISFADWMSSNSYKQEFCGLSKINHSKDLFALYYNEKLHYKGIVKDENNDDIRLSEIPKNEKAIAYFIFQKDEYSTYCKQYKEYWDWMKLRNEERYTTNIAHEKNYDSKNMMHTIRLLKVAKELVETGNLNVKRTEDRDELLAIKNGDFSYEEVIEKAENLQREIEEKSKLEFLPSKINSSKIEKFLINLRTKLYENN